MCCWLFPAPGVRVTRRNHMMLTTIQHTGASQTAATNTVIWITRISGNGGAKGMLVRNAPSGTQSKQGCYPIVLVRTGDAYAQGRNAVDGDCLDVGGESSGKHHRR